MVFGPDVTFGAGRPLQGHLHRHPEAPLPAPIARGAALAATAALALLLLLLLSPGAPAHAAAAAAKRCASVPFPPNSDDIAANVRARGVSCRTARELIRSSEGRPPARFRGFSCTRRRVEEGVEMPYTRVRCVKGAASVRWDRF